MRGWHHCCGWGHGWHHRLYAHTGPRWGRCCCPPWAVPLTREEEIEMLREEADWLKKQLEAVSQRLADLEKATGESGR
jgi:ubiquinone biosynthesis protein UbiJ